MSRDFELLQRLEREWSRPVGDHVSSSGVVSALRHNDKSTIAQERASAVTLPTAHLAPMIRNELNKLVLRIFLSVPPTKVVVFTGVEAKASAKWIAGCTADILAGKVDGRVCLVDADFASPGIHRLYSVSNHNGLATVLAGSCSVGDSTRRAGENLWIVPAGTESSNLQIAAATFRSIMVEILEQFDYVILAAPDCDKQTSLGVFGSESEGAVLVIDAATTHRAAAREAKSALEMAKIRVLGSVFNNRQVSVPDFIYLHM